MHPALPDSIERYFTAQNRHDGAALAACFIPTGSVRDEGEDRVGPAEIEAWARGTAARYGATATPLSARTEKDLVEVLARVAGQFPGSPIELTFRFALAEDGRIRRLEIG